MSAILEEKDGWAHIRTADDYLGWTPLSALLPGKPYAAGGRVAEVQSLFAHIYREASVTKHAPLITVPFESRLEVVAEPKEDGRWLQVRLPDDRAGWVQAGDISLEPKRLTHSARRWNSPSAFSACPIPGAALRATATIAPASRRCWAGGAASVMPRDAQPQADWSGVAAVERKDLQPGDLLYFGASEKKITHTGIYMGDGKFINATTHLTPMVRIDDLNDAYWSKLLVAARRLK